MTILFFNSGSAYRLRAKRKISEGLKKIAASEGASLKLLNIVLCSDEYIQEINQAYLSHDYVTDVISFHYPEASTGEIFAGVEQAQQQSADFGSTHEQELHRLFVHGLLHICGYDDQSPREKEEMTRLENEYLALHFAF